jgi:copper(I)-binding protein
MLKSCILSLMLALAACSPGAPKISVHDAWARDAGMAESTAAYLTIQNAGGADTLIGVRSNVGVAMLHESSVDGGVMRMRPIDPKEGLVVPSNGKLLLGPGGTHVMLTGLARPLRTGDHFALTLLFRKAKPAHVSVTVKPAAQ